MSPEQFTTFVTEDGTVMIRLSVGSYIGPLNEWQN